MQRLKNWMLPAAMILGTVFHPWLIRAAFLMPWLIFFMLLFTFARIGPRDIRFQRMHIVLLAIQLAGCLGVYWVCCRWDPVIAEALFICVLAPTATAAAVITGLLGGSVGFLTSYILASNVLVSVGAPILFSWIGTNRALPFRESAWDICGEVMPMLILPLAVAWIIRRFWPRLQRRMLGLQQVPFYLWALSLTIVTGNTVYFLVEQDNPQYTAEWWIAGLSLVVCVLHFVIGRRLGRRRGDPVSAGQALMQKNTVLAIWLSHAYLSPTASVGPAAYILWQNILNSWQLARKNRKQQQT
jgi:BASS family bile acid:Na+ symporter